MQNALFSVHGSHDLLRVESSLKQERCTAGRRGTDLAEWRNREVPHTRGPRHSRQTGNRRCSHVVARELSWLFFCRIWSYHYRRVNTHLQQNGVGSCKSTGDSEQYTATIFRAEFEFDREDRSCLLLRDVSWLPAAYTTLYRRFTDYMK
jgi:hypothetical protein